MVKVSPLKDNEKQNFAKLFTDYYSELDCADDAAHLAEEYVIPDLLAGLISVDILYDGGQTAGFIIYQTDDIDNDWNFKEGWGDVREIYVVPSLRRQGLGRFLLYTAEMKLKERGVQKAYCLPCAGSEGFFRACGYVGSASFNEDTDCFVFEKTNLNNKCK